MVISVNGPSNGSSINGDDISSTEDPDAVVSVSSPASDISMVTDVMVEPVNGVPSPVMDSAPGFSSGSTDAVGGDSNTDSIMFPGFPSSDAFPGDLVCTFPDSGLLTSGLSSGIADPNMGSTLAVALSPGAIVILNTLSPSGISLSSDGAVCSDSGPLAVMGTFPPGMTSTFPLVETDSGLPVS